MVASDTMVGIIGAAVLVAVMVGVFVYEYNNEPEAGGAGDDMRTDAENRTAFLAMYPDLNATDDIDGDGIANYMDSDVDGDGVNNTADDMTMFEREVNGSLAAATAPGTAATSFPFPVGEGAEQITVEIDVTPTAALPYQVCIEVTAPGGGAPTRQCSQSSPVTLTAPFVGAGEYVLTVSQGGMGGPVAGAGSPVDYAGSIMVHYAGMSDEPHEM